LNDALSQLQDRLQHSFKDASLLERAVTHRSYSADHNERLEFLGDSVLNLAVAHLLYKQLSDLPEGDLSRVRANLVKQETLHQLALSLQISSCLKFHLGRCLGGFDWGCFFGCWL
jgi:ribonuclease-3